MSNLRNLLALPIVSLKTVSQVGAVEKFIIDVDVAGTIALLTVKPDFPKETQNILSAKEAIIYGVFLRKYLTSALTPLRCETRARQRILPLLPKKTAALMPIIV